MIRSEFEQLEEFLWGGAFWSEGYFCESIGARDEGAVRRYIRAQQDSGRGARPSKGQ